MFRRWQRRVVNPKVLRRNLFDRAHDRTYNWVVQPVLVGTGVFTVLYLTARYQNIQYNAYKDPHYPPTTLAPTSRHLPEWQRKGLNNEEYYCVEKEAIFSPHHSTTIPPACISKNITTMAQVLSEKPEMWEKFRKLETSNGVSFLKVVKNGFDNASAPVPGAVAGDQESLTVFRELFENILGKRHKAYAADVAHPESNFNVNELSGERIDASGDYVKSTRVSVSRNVSGYLLSPSIDFKNRREVEKAVAKGLEELDGEYHPLFGNRSIRKKPYGMSPEQQEELAMTTNYLFGAPTNVGSLSAGMGRHWPDARGLFCNEDKNLFVQLNDEEHVRIIAEEKGDNLQAVASRVATTLGKVEASLQKDGKSFAHDEHFGFVNANLDNLGSGLTAEVTLSIPNLSSHPKFSDLASKLGIVYSGTGNNLTIRNESGFGISEVALVNLVSQTTSYLVGLERALEKGTNIDAQLF